MLFGAAGTPRNGDTGARNLLGCAGFGVDEVRSGWNEAGGGAWQWGGECGE